MPEQCPQLAKLPAQSRKFWEDKQRELQDTLIRFSYAVLTVPAELSSVDQSGLLYLMQQNLWFEDFPKPPPLISIGKPREYQKTLIRMPVAALEKFEVIPESVLKMRFQDKPQHSGFFRNLAYFLGVNPKYLLFSGKLAAGSRFQYAFREIDEPQVWVQTLSALLT